MVTKVFTSRPKCCWDPLLNERAIFQHVICIKSGMPVCRHLKLPQIKRKLLIAVPWNGLGQPEGTLEPSQQAQKDVSDPLVKLFHTKSTLQTLIIAVRATYGVEGEL